MYAIIDKATFSFQKPNFEKLNGPFDHYTISYKKEQSGAAEVFARVTNKGTNFFTLTSLDKWTAYFIKVRVKNRDHGGPWSVDHPAKTQQDGLSTIVLNSFHIVYC